ncbi:MAG: polyprenyl synthetase family protein [Rhizonema sp. PD37]|nr:polyprenyl synthetase family protein [Rhizonema sp. PD37]
MRQRRQDVADEAKAFVKSYETTTLQSKVLATALSGLRALDYNRSKSFVPCVHLPLLVYAGVSGNDEQAVPLSVALSLLELGIDLLDNLADQELPLSWQGYSSSVIQLTATKFVCCLPQLALMDLDASTASLLTIQQMLAQGLLKIAAGQLQDLEFQESSHPNVEDVQASVLGKSGERRGMYAALAAQLAGASLETVEAYAEMGRSLGMVLQFTSDCTDIFTAAHSRDLANGTRTLPIALHLQQLQDTERASFLDLLAKAKVDLKARQEVQASLVQAGGLRRCAYYIEYFRQRTKQSLEIANPKEPALSWFKEIISNVSVLSLENKK